MQPRYATFAEAIVRVAEEHPKMGFVFQDMAGEETFYSYPQVAEETERRAAALQQMGLTKGDRVGLIVVEPEAFVLNFLAAIRAGVIPVPLYPPLSFGALDAYAERTARVLELSGTKVLIASSKLQNVLWGLVDQVPCLQKLIRAEDVTGEGLAKPTLPDISPQDVAFLQYTSGSTADPKGVIVTHASLCANCHVILDIGLEVNGAKGDVTVSWLPLYHDMGLIGFVLSTLYVGLKSVLIPTMRFIKKPTVWFDAIHKHRGVVSFAPNFAYALITRKAKPEQLAQWDLSSMRAFGCGAEPIHPDVMRTFNDTFGTHSKLNATAVMPAYGMAEATLAMCFKPLGRTFGTRVVDAVSYQQDGVVRAPVPGGPTFEHVSCGPVFPHHEMSVKAEDGTVLPEGHEGELCFKGPSVAAGYFENPEATAATFKDGWLHTGDLGYILDGEVYVTGRLKDLIILNGRNVHPQAIEWRAAEVDGVRKGNVVAFARPGANSEELVVVCEVSSDDHDRIKAEVARVVRQEIGVGPADVVCLAPGSLPKTSSGKLQRRKTRSQYILNALGADGVRTMGSSGSTLTVARHLAKGLWSRAKARLASTL